MSKYRYKGRKNSNRKSQVKYNSNFNKQTNEIKFYFKKNNYKKTLELIEEYLIIHPDDMYVQTYKAMTLFRLSKVAESKEIFEKVLNCDYLSERVRIFAMSQYANVLPLMDNTNLAIYYLECIINESDDIQLVARSKLSSLYADVGRYTDAFNVLKIDGFNNKFLNLKRAKIFTTMQIYNKAIKALEQEECNDYNYRIIEKFDDSFLEQEENYLKGHALYKLNLFDLSLSYLSKASINKNMSICLKANIDIIRIYILKSEIDDAINLCEESIKYNISPYYENIFKQLLAKCYLRKNDYKKAQEKYNDLNVTEDEKNINLGSLESLKGDFKKAEDYFSKVNLINYNIRDNYELYYKILLSKVRLEKYDEAIQIIDEFFKNVDKYEIKEMSFELKRIKLYIEVKQNKVIDREVDIYSSRQIISYDASEALNHIVDHHKNNVKTSKFSDKIDIEKLFHEVKALMDEEKIIYDSLFDKYIIKYPNIGINKNNENIHQLVVLTLPDTKDIITMYPCDGTESIFNLYELEEPTKPKVKRLSQIEKFNKKYGNN